MSLTNVFVTNKKIAIDGDINITNSNLALESTQEQILNIENSNNNLLDDINNSLDKNNINSYAFNSLAYQSLFTFSNDKLLCDVVGSVSINNQISNYALEDTLLE